MFSALNHKDFWKSRGDQDEEELEPYFANGETDAYRNTMTFQVHPEDRQQLTNP